MNRGIYATATGMISSQKWLEVAANNIANVSTHGFKRDSIAFKEMFVRQMHLDGGRGASIGTLGSGSVMSEEFTVFDRGIITVTGNELDLAIDADNGLFAVQTPQGVRYTRDGAFQLNAQRQIVTKAGFPVLDDGGNPIEVPLGQVTIGLDGIVTVDDQQIAKITAYDGNFRKQGSNLFNSADAEPNDEIMFKPGAIEGSNVNAVEAMIEMVAVNRSFEMAQRSITQQDELTQQLIQSLRDR